MYQCFEIASYDVKKRQSWMAFPEAQRECNSLVALKWLVRIPRELRTTHRKRLRQRGGNEKYGKHLFSMLPLESGSGKASLQIEAGRIPCKDCKIERRK
jgi:hypothetical protein